MNAVQARNAFAAILEHLGILDPHDEYWASIVSNSAWTLASADPDTSEKMCR